jgi:hypothetical protein
MNEARSGRPSWPRLTLLAAVVVNGLLVGASLDQVIKQLPARRAIGAVAFSAYSRAGDLGNGIAWYAGLGLGGAALALAAAVSARIHSPGSRGWSLMVVVATVGHLAVTAVAAPLNFSQRQHIGDPVALAGILDRFARLSEVRAGLQCLALIGLTALVWGATP